MKEIKTVDAVGHVLCHDVTRIVRGVTKGAAFSKGHVVTEADISLLLSMGKENLFVWETREGMLHENEAAEILYDICADENMHPSDIKEGKIEIIAACDGFFSVDTKRLYEINTLGELIVSTRPGGVYVRKGDKLAGTRAIPLVISEEKMNKAKSIAKNEPLLSIHPLKLKKAAVFSIGSEVYKKYIEDTFTSVIEEKLAEYGVHVTQKAIYPDNPEIITKGILSAVSGGAELIICAGGMSVDPDDRTPLAIKNTGASIICYGIPVLPGSMLMLGYYTRIGNPKAEIEQIESSDHKSEKCIPIVGLPACAMYGKRTIFDILLPKLLADIRISNTELAAMGYGGFCLDCGNCVFPNCGFGKGV